MKIQNKKSGYSIIEILVYLAIFTGLSAVVINSFVVILFSFNTTIMNRALIESGTMVMERMSREIRQSNNVDIANSSIGTNSGVLQLNSNDLTSGNPVVIKFEALNQDLNFYRDGNLIDNLLGQNILVDSLIFRRISNANSEAIKIEMTLSYSKGQNFKSANFYNTIILRGGY